MDILYTVRTLPTLENKTYYGVYENENLVEIFDTYEQAITFMNNYKKTML